MRTATAVVLLAALAVGCSAGPSTPSAVSVEGGAGTASTQEAQQPTGQQPTDDDLATAHRWYRTILGLEDHDAVPVGTVVVTEGVRCGPADENYGSEFSWAIELVSSDTADSAAAAERAGGTLTAVGPWVQTLEVADLAAADLIVHHSWLVDPDGHATALRAWADDYADPRLGAADVSDLVEVHLAHERWREPELADQHVALTDRQRRQLADLVVAAEGAYGPSEVWPLHVWARGSAFFDAPGGAAPAIVSVGDIVGEATTSPVAEDAEPLWAQPFERFTGTDVAVTISGDSAWSVPPAAVGLETDGTPAADAEWLTERGWGDVSGVAVAPDQSVEVVVDGGVGFVPQGAAADLGLDYRRPQPGEWDLVCG